MITFQHLRMDAYSDIIVRYVDDVCVVGSVSVCVFDADFSPKDFVFIKFEYIV